MRWKQHPQAVLAMLGSSSTCWRTWTATCCSPSRRRSRATWRSATRSTASWPARGVVLSFGVMASSWAVWPTASRTKVMAFGIALWSLCTGASGAAQTFEQMVAVALPGRQRRSGVVPGRGLAAGGGVQGLRRRAVGVFFMGIPLGIGTSFARRATLAPRRLARHLRRVGRRWAFRISVPLLLASDERAAPEEGALPPAARSIGSSCIGAGGLREQPRFRDTPSPASCSCTSVSPGPAFVQLWLVRERGFEAAAVARQIGVLQLVRHAGSLAGGWLATAWRAGCRATPASWCCCNCCCAGR